MKEQTTVSNSYIISRELTSLREIQQTNINISIWERQAIPKVDQWLTHLIKSDFREIKLNTSTETFRNDFEQALLAYQSLQPVGFQLFLEDADLLLQEFSNIAQADTFKVLWAVIDNGMCRRFHTDANKLRLLCTYQGPGTQWVKSDNINYDLTHYTGNEMIINQQEIQQANPYDVVILKGALHTHRDVPPILHRSPPLSGENEKRILLRIDLEDSI